MSLTPDKAKAIAKKLIGGKFAAFAKDCTLINATGWNNSTQTATTEARVVKFIRFEFESNQFDGQNIRVNDYQLIAEYSLIDIPVNADSTSCIFDGETLDIKRVTLIDTAAIILHVRRK
jgi:hypothetical protein